MKAIVCFACASLFLTGCYRIRRAYSGPDVPPLILAGSDLDELRTRISCDRRAFLAGRTPSSSTLTCQYGSKSITVQQPVTVSERNGVQQMLLSASDEHYFKVRSHLLNSRNTLTFGAEVTGVTLSSVAAIIGDAETKTILSTASSLVQSTKTAIDKDFYAEQTSSALVSTMDSLRDNKKAQIITSEKKSLDDYGFEAALNDALAYDDAGAVHTALLKLATEAGKQKDDASKKLNTALQ